MPVELTKQQLGELADLKALHEEIATELDKAERAGLDMSEYRAKLEQLEAVRTGLLKVYGGSTRRRNVG